MARYRPLFGSRRREALWQRETLVAHRAGQGPHPVCNLCGLPVVPGQDWDESHDPGRAKAFGGKLTAIAHRLCNLRHGSQTVTPALAKAARVRRKHLGIAGPGLGDRPMRGGRRSLQKRSVSGRVLPRLTLSQRMAALNAKRAILWRPTPAIASPPARGPSAPPAGLPD